MIDYRKEADQIKDEIISNRRTIHRFAETGFDLAQTKAFVKETLASYGIEPKDCGKSGVTAVIGEGDRCILLRADMDALPMKEESGLDFAAENGNCHSCGHDSHAAMLLGAAKLLKRHEQDLKGKVKLMFQPAEELLAGAEDMVKNGLLEAPKVDVGFGMHIISGASPVSDVGNIAFVKGFQTFSGDFVKISIEGLQAHGSMPHKGVDAINIAAHIVTALHELSAHEVTNEERSVVLVGKIYGGSSCNTESGECVLEVSVRAETFETRQFLKQRVKEISEGIAASFRGKAIVENVYGMPPMYNDPSMTDIVPGYIRELVGEDRVTEVFSKTGTEDFAYVSERIPSMYVLLGTGSIAGDGIVQHNPSIILDEDAFPLGTAIYAHTATRWLEEHC
ncbi:MAG: amidohydrolase [Oscillospiraceae bacterium]|nr:amidohydrolase [Oscillospiraceae bacterium]